MTAPLLFTDGPKLSAAEIRALVAGCRASQQTGVLAMEAEAGRSLVLFLKRGEVVNAFLVSPQTYENISPEQWNARIDAAAGAQTRLILLSAQGVLMAKLLIQNTGGKSETFTHPIDVNEVLETQRKAALTSLVRLDWEAATGAVAYYRSAETRYSLYLSTDAVEEQTGVVPALAASNRQNCRVTVFGAGPSVGAWQEYLLRRAFTDICEGILYQFQTLAGRNVVDSLIRLILVFASRRNLNINFVSRKVVDEEFFSSPQEAADHYRPLLTEMLAHCSGISGSRLLSSALREIINILPEQERMAIHDFSLLNEGYIYERNH